MSVCLHAHRKRLATLTRAAVACALAGIAVGALVTTSGCMGGGVASDAANDQVLRTARLAGYPAAGVGVDRQVAAIELGPPAVSSAADVELAWQTGVAALAAAYPDARDYRVVVSAAGSPLLQADFAGKAARAAVESDDSGALKKAAEFELLVGPEGRADAMPRDSATSDGQEAELDRTNRAAGLSTPSGPGVAGADALAAAWRKAYAEAPGVAAPSGGSAEAARYAANRVRHALSRGALGGAESLEKTLPRMVADEDVAALRRWAAVCEAATADKALPSVLALTASAAREAANVVRNGRGPGAHEQVAGAVTDLERVSALDALGSAEGTGVVATTLARFGVEQDGLLGLVWRPVDARETDAPRFAGAEVWNAFRGPDGTVYWRAGVSGDVALTDTPLLGWGYRVPSASLVDASDVTRVVATYSAMDDQ